jgi:hypothetical protein
LTTEHEINKQQIDQLGKEKRKKRGHHVELGDWEKQNAWEGQRRRFVRPTNAHVKGIRIWLVKALVMFSFPLQNPIL